MKQVILITASLGLLFNSCNRIERKVNSGIDKMVSAKDSIRKQFDPSPKEIFEERTGLKLTTEQKKLVETDNYFPLEGEYSQVFIVTADQLETWSNEEPPWNSKEWLTGRIPNDVLNKFENGNTISGNIIYAINEICCEDENLRFHNGQALILQLDSQKVWYVNWDY